MLNTHNYPENPQQLPRSWTEAPTKPDPLLAFLESYRACGLDIIPLYPGRKDPIYKDWPTREAGEQLQQALEEKRGFNLGARGGGQAGLVVVDCEDEETFRRVVDWLDMNFVSGFPIVRSASGNGLHIWLKCDDRPAGFDTSRKLAPHFGPGEVILGPGAQAVVPPSIAWSKRAGRNGQYSFEEPLELLDEMKAVDWDVVATLLANQRPDGEDDARQPDGGRASKRAGLQFPVRLLKQPAPPLVYELLRILDDAPKGEPIPHPRGSREPYASRSEAEEAVIATLILCGWTFDMIHNLFKQRQPGHYREHANPTAYFETSYRNAAQALLEDPTRQEIAACYNQVISAPWLYGGHLGREVYEQILLVAWRERDWEPVILYADLQALTGASKGGIAAALDRLEEYGLIERLASAEVDYLRMRVVRDAQFSNNSHRGGLGGELPHVLTAGILEVLGDLAYTVVPVYRALLFAGGVLSMQEIVEVTGIGRNTVSRRLLDLEEHGLVVRVGRYAWRVVDGVGGIVGKVVGDVVEAVEKPAVGVEAVPVFGRAIVFAGMPVKAEGVCPDCGCSEGDPVEAYVEVMWKVFGVRINPERLSSRLRERLQDLAVTLGCLYMSGCIGAFCSGCYMHWIARRLRRWVAEKGWPVIWVDVIACNKLLNWYTDEWKERAALGLWQPWPDMFLMPVDMVVETTWRRAARDQGVSGSAGGAVVAVTGAGGETPEIVPSAADPIVAHYNDGWVARCAPCGQQYLDQVPTSTEGDELP